MDDKTPTVSVTALEAHTHQGKSYDIGDTYECTADVAASLKVQGKAILSEDYDAAKQKEEDAKKES